MELYRRFLGTALILCIFFPIFHSNADTADVSVEITILECSDGLDNDGDGFIDYPNDPGCDSAIDDSEEEIYQCSDGLDNDGDGFIDFPDDIGCGSLTDDDETNATPPISSGGGGGGGGTSRSEAQGIVEITGNAFPQSDIFLLKNGVEVLSVKSDEQATFAAVVEDLSRGNYIFSIYGRDRQGLKSPVFSFPLNITKGTRTTISGVYLAPTFTSDKLEVTKGESIDFFGFTAPQADVVVKINSEVEYEVVQRSGENGAFLVRFNTGVLEIGHHEAKAQSKKGDDVSNFGNEVGFIVGDKTVVRTANQVDGDGLLRGDVNGDMRVNLVDFSIASFWYKKILSPQIMYAEEKSLNGDGRIDLVDFSIMAANWTG